jgi:hypothetical protein
MTVGANRPGRAFFLAAAIDLWYERIRQTPSPSGAMNDK